MLQLEIGVISPSKVNLSRNAVQRRRNNDSRFVAWNVESAIGFLVSIL